MNAFIRFLWLSLVGVFLYYTACYRVMPNKFAVKLGIDILKREKFDIIKGKRIGVLTNQAAVDSIGNPTWKILKEVCEDNLIAIFAPEHGLKGKFLAGETFSSDEEDGILVYAMYGYDAKPKKSWLEEIDMIVIDLQDLGIRHYTYYSSMIYMLAACAEEQIPVVVLDRPNPLGRYIGGPSMDKKWCSFLGPIANMPMFHGMTIGEIANYVKNADIDIDANDSNYYGEYTAPLHVSSKTLANLDLQIIKMEFWERDMTWPEIGIPWNKNSPRISTWSSVLDYAMVPILHLVCKNPDCKARLYVDFANDRHFGNIYLKNKDCNDVLDEIESIKPKILTGCSMRIAETQDQRRGKIKYLSLNVKDIKKTIPAILSLALLSISQRNENGKKNIDWIDCDEDLKSVIAKGIGDDELISALFDGKEIDIKYFREKWDFQAKEFIKSIAKYYLYNE
ncbi:MAG: DUF1343 domain-containing protein [Puniceicoccales bacterium]|jgi:hypothetical protein|nr:DUF1343 domain-containing protein [Puniceicoccales bacterium]